MSAQIQNLCNINAHVHVHTFCRGSVVKAMKHGVTWGLSQSMIFFAFGTAFGYGTYLVAKHDMSFEDVFR